MTMRAAVSDVDASDSKTGSPAHRIKVRQNDRVFIVGKTGSGKTTLVTILLVQVKFPVILDPKHQFSFRDVIKNFRSENEFITSDLKEAIRIDYDIPIIYRPSITECKAGCPTFWEWILYRENCIVYVDEVIAVSPSVNMPYGYARAVQMGRGKNIGVWSATQRPARIPQNLLSESEHVIAFELRNPVDIKRIADYTDPIIINERATDHDFWYYNVRDKKPIMLNANQVRIK